MAVQAGMSLSRILIIGGAGTILFNNGKLSDVFRELQGLIKGLETKGDSSDSDTDAIASQMRRLAMEVRQLRSAGQLTIVNGNSGNLTSLVAPVATLGVLGYAYMWWKGYSFSNIMFVTKENMTKAVSNLTESLNQVNDCLASAQKYLTQRIEKVDEKVDDQLETSKALKNEVIGLHALLSQIGDDLAPTQHIISGLYEKMSLLEKKQEQTIIAIDYLCDYVEGKAMRRPEILQRQLKASNECCGFLTSTDKPKLQGKCTFNNNIQKLQYVLD